MATDDSSLFVELHGLGPSRRSQVEPGRARKSQQLSPGSLRNLLKGLTAGSHPFGKPGPERNEELSYDSFLFVELHRLGPSVKPRKHYNAFKKA